MLKTCLCLLKALIITFFLLSLHAGFLFAAADRPTLAQINDIRDTVRLAQNHNLPILIMFGTEHCPYCEMLREDFLIPMIISGDYTDKVILREVHVAYDANIIDFSGIKVSTRDFADRYDVKLFPTMVLIDSKGRPLVKKIIGITTPSLFGGTLDASIDEALMLTKKIIPAAK